MTDPRGTWTSPKVWESACPPDLVPIDWVEKWKARAEAAEAALLEAKADAAREANEANHQARDCGYAQERARAMMERAEAAEAALAEAQKSDGWAAFHAAQTKLAEAQRQLREMREALENKVFRLTKRLQERRMIILEGSGDEGAEG